MRRASVFAAALLACVAAGLIAQAGVDAPAWNAARKKFYREYSDLEKLPDLIDEMAALDDKRAVELLCRKTLFHENFDIRVRTFDALAGTTDADAVKFLADKVRRDEKKRLTYTWLLKYLSGEKVGENIKRALRDKRWEVVSAALEAARKHADKSLLPVLKQKLSDKNSRLAYEAALACEACGEDVPSSLKLSPAGGIFPSKIFSGKCVVLLDISDDMSTRMALPPHAVEELVGALKSQLKPKEYDSLMAKLKDESKPEKYEEFCVKTRQFYCANMTARALATLERTSEANVIIYSVGAALWQRKFKKLSSKDIKSLRSYLNNRMTRPARDLYTALRMAMDVEDLDTIHVITCGLPAGARIEDTERILSWLREANYERSVRIHTAVVLSDYRDGKPTDEYRLAFEKSKEPVLAFYRKIAEQNGGEFRSLTHLGRVPVSAAAPEPRKEDKKGPKKEEPKEDQPKKEETKKEETKKEEPPKKEEAKKKPPKKKDDDWLPKRK